MRWVGLFLAEPPRPSGQGFGWVTWRKWKWQDVWVGINMVSTTGKEGSAEKKQLLSSLAMRQSPKSDNYLLEHTNRDIQHPRIGSKWEDGVGWEVTCTRETLQPIHQWIQNETLGGNIWGWFDSFISPSKEEMSTYFKTWVPSGDCVFKWAFEIADRFFFWDCTEPYCSNILIFITTSNI